MASSPALADDGAPITPGFATLDRGDAVSRIGTEVSYLSSSGSDLFDPVYYPDVTAVRLDLHGQYFDSRNRFGAYAQLPITYTDTGSSGGRSAAGVGNFELGVLYVPRLPSASVGLVLRAGGTVGIAAERGWGDPNLYGGLMRLADLYLAIPKGTSVRLAVSPMLQRGTFFARADLGVDVNLSVGASDGGASDARAATLLRLGVGIGFVSDPFAFTLETMNVCTEPTGLQDCLHTGAVSIRYLRERVHPFAGVTLPLDTETQNYLDAVITAGVDVDLP